MVGAASPFGGGSGAGGSPFTRNHLASKIFLDLGRVRSMEWSGVARVAMYRLPLSAAVGNAHACNFESPIFH